MADFNQPQTPNFIAPATREDLLFYWLNLARRETTALAARVVEGTYGITRREWGILTVLNMHDGCSPSELAEYMQLDRSRVSRVLPLVLEKGLIRRERSAAGKGSRITLWLTPAGCELYRVIFRRIAALNTSIAQSLDVDENVLLASALAKIVARCHAVAIDGSIGDKVDRRGGGTRQRW